MAMLKHLLWATDFSESANAALEYCIVLAKLTNASMTLLHIAEAEEAINEKLTSEHRQRLEAIASELSQSGFAVTTVIRSGQAAKTIVEVVKEANADLVVLGAHGRTSFREKLLGSTTEQVLTTSPVPVLFVRERKEPRFQHLLVPSDLSDDALPALDFTIRLAELTKAKISLLHIVAPFEGSPEAWDELKREIASELKVWSERSLAPEAMPTIEPKVKRYHHPGAGITDFARENDVDLIIIPTHGRSALGMLIIGSVAAHVIYYASCPVISGRAEAFKKVVGNR